MSHRAQKRFCRGVRRKYRHFFHRKIVVDVGSLDINGSNRPLFSRCFYRGIDIVKGDNVDIVGCAHTTLPIVADIARNHLGERYRRRIDFTDKPVIDVIISTEMLEHDKYYRESLRAMYEHLTGGGLLLITCAGDGRAEHGTTKHHAWTSPGTNDYYCNLSNQMFAEVLPPEMFSVYHLAQDRENFDLQFYGIKK